MLNIVKRASLWPVISTIVFGVFLLSVRAGAADTQGVKTETGVRVKMRDGVSPVADVYRPENDGQFPVLLQRTPYDRKGAAGEGRELASHGYIVVIQDTRGRFDSEGEFYPFRYETDDGFD